MIQSHFFNETKWEPKQLQLCLDETHEDIWTTLLSNLRPVQYHRAINLHAQRWTLVVSVNYPGSKHSWVALSQLKTEQQGLENDIRGKGNAFVGRDDCHPMQHPRISQIIPSSFSRQLAKFMASHTCCIMCKPLEDAEWPINGTHDNK